MSHRQDELHDETRPVDRHVDDPAHTHAAGYTPPRAEAQPAGSQVNVNADRGTTVGPAAPGPLYYARRIVTLLFGILAVLLGLRILLLLLAANPGNPIVDGIYGITEPFVAPFRGVFAIDQVSPTGNSVFDVAAVVALVGWALIYLLIIAILSLGDRTRAA